MATLIAPKETSSHRDSVCEQNEGGNPAPGAEERRNRNWNVGNKWGFSTETIFGLALRFFKEMNGKAFSPTYEENLLFVALQKQIFLGPYNSKLCPEIGFFDVLGNDRRKKWAELGSTAKEDAMEDFVKLLDSCCSRFSPYVASHKIEMEEHERRLREEEERLRLAGEEEKRKEEADRLLSNFPTQQVEAGINIQSQQENANPHSSDQQRLVRQPRECVLQTHHAHRVKQHNTTEATLPDDTTSVTRPIHQSSPMTSSETNPRCHLFVENMPGEVPILAPSMWTTPGVNEFKEKTQREAESVITVGRGEVLTVHIPTHDHGSTFFWEFATDYYDIAFGLYFEWPSKANGAGNESESQDAGRAENVKDGQNLASACPRISEVVPMFRRDSHENVYAGSHQYPSQGVYLLRFDNSYSLWRSKVVYYRVYYTG